jgi:predicted transcriptional regulator
METIRIRLTKDHKARLQEIADRDNRSITGTIRQWIEADKRTDQRAHEVFGGGSGGNTRSPNKEYIR